MEQLHIWVASIERAAANLYRAASGYFAADPAFSAFLQRLAAEEEWHCRLLQEIPDEMVYPLLPDPETRQWIEEHFRRAAARLSAGLLDRDEMHAVLATAEFSEWNDFFLYCLGNLRGDGAEYRNAVTEISRHKQEIVDYFAAIPGGDRYLAVVRDLPEVENRRILVVENRPALALLLRGALAALGEVELAETGSDGLALVERQRFDVVLSDVDLAPMESLDFYQKAVGLDPALLNRFVFFADNRATGELPDGKVPLPAVIAAPALLGQIRQAVAQVARGGRPLH